MKDILKGFVLGFVLVMILVALVSGYCKAGEYTVDGVITTVANEHWVDVRTSDGNIWEFDGYGFEEGQKVRVTFCDMDTENRLDDEIINVM